METPKLTAEEVRLFLQENQDFTEDYFIVNATSSMIEKWFDHRSKGNNRNGHVYRHASFNNDTRSLTEQVLHEEDSQEVQESLDQQGPRRNSEPVAATRIEKQAAFKLRDMRKKKALTQYRVHHHNLPSEGSYVLSYDSRHHEINKPSLRKTQSAPIYKSVLSRLINSTVYLRSYPPQDMRSKLDLRSSSEDAFLTEIIHDILKDLNLESLCYKLVINVGIITDAYEASLYLVEKVDQRKLLRICYENLKLHPSSDDANFGRRLANNFKLIDDDDIIGQVAKNGKTIETKEVDDNNTEEDTQHEREILCKPIKNLNGEVVAVISLTGRKGSGGFRGQDDSVLERYLKFCGISITNAKLFSVSKEEFDRNKALLELAHGIFEEQTSLNNIVNQTLRKAIDLFSCKQCVLMLIADEKHANLISAETSRFSHVFKMSASNGRSTEMQFSSVMRNSMDFDMVEDDCGSDHMVDYVSLTGKIYNSAVMKKNNLVNSNGENEPFLCIPFRDNQFQIIGVLKLSRKVGDPPFNEKDEQILEAFTIFSGLGISNCILYDEVCRAKVHQKVALEVLSYHTSASQLEVDRLKLSSVPTSKAFHLYDFKFDDFQLIDGQMLTAAVRMFMEFDFLKKYQIKYETFCRWLLTVKKNYRRVIYHNWRHAFNVAQSMFAVLTTGKLSEKLSSLECLALLVGCLCHDLDHRGTNNEFQTRSETPLGKLYGTSPLEHHHFNHAVAILNSEGNNIFQSLSSSEYSEVMRYLKHAILATDLTQYFKCRGTLFPLIEKQKLDIKKKEHRNMLRGILMTACDLSGITKPWDIQKKKCFIADETQEIKENISLSEVVHLVTSEFFHQGDIEREKLQVEPKAMMDRKHILQLPKCQVQFFNSTGIPVYKALSLLSSPLKSLEEGALSNRNQWEKLSKKIDEGTVDPELDPVFKPVDTDEDFTYL